MALKRIITEKVALERTYEKLRRELDLLPDNHADFSKVETALNETKARMVRETKPRTRPTSKSNN